MAKKKTDTKKAPVTVVEEPLYTTGGNMDGHHIPDECYVTRGADTKRARAASVHQRSGFNRNDMDAHRPGDKLPTDHNEIIAACQALYRRIGIVRNIIDLMADFSSEGLALTSPIKSQERFFNKWAKKVDLAGRAHDFMKLLLRDANIVIRRKNAKISLKMKREMSKAASLQQLRGLTITEDEVEELSERVTDPKKPAARDIPWKYTFLSPVLIEKIGGSVGRFFGDNTIAMRIPVELRNSISSPKTEAERDYVSNLPAEVVKAVRESKGDALVKLDPDKMYVDYYKKDDWDEWGTPFLYGVMEDIMLKEKMRLADIAALDGVINVVRLWKLGNTDKQILPTKTAVNKLIGILQHNVGGGVMDIVWDDMIDLSVEYPPTDKILGPDKYRSVDNDIVRGLGIPDSLLGGVDLGTRNAESAYVQLKTLTERLEYVRARCIAWIENELRLVADAMGFKRTPRVTFGIMSLRNEAAEKQLLIQLMDRGIVSIESVQKVFGYDFAIELTNLRAEQKIREVEPAILEKGNPYFRPITTMTVQHQFRMELEALKIAGQIKVNDEGNNGGGGENPIGDQPRDDGNNPPGRPPNSVDTNPRDERTTQTQSVYRAIAERLLIDLDAVVDPKFLAHHKVKNMRSLTKAQKQELEDVKFSVFATLDVGDVVTAELVSARLSKDISKVVAIFNRVFSLMHSDFCKVSGRGPNLAERRSLAASAWAELR